MPLNEIEKLTETYAKARSRVADLLAALEAEQLALVRRELPGIRKAVAATADHHAALRSAIEAEPELFEKPRSYTFSGVKVGRQTQRGKVKIDDEQKTIERIRRQLPEEQAVLLVTVRESVHKPSVADLKAADLKRLGIRIEGDTENTVIKPQDSDVDKAVNALLKQFENITSEEAA